MKKVTLLGDSIRLIGYGTKVADLLGEGYTVYQSDKNGKFAANTLRMLYDEREQIAGSNVIHWNNGHWDICNLFGDGSFTPEQVYIDTMVRLARMLKAITPNVIFATTTPVRNDNRHSSNAAIEHYNNLIVPYLRAEGVRINDLYALLAPETDRVIREDDKIHLTAYGIERSAAAVAAAIHACTGDA